MFHRVLHTRLEDLKTSSEKKKQDILKRLTIHVSLGSVILSIIKTNTA